ncbi:MAG TPA: helix-turn-helix domain-containing protein [Acidiphilium sp.]|nr:helix-turn-helix domain-containing protein [Acidiphilium sp.]
MEKSSSGQEGRDIAWMVTALSALAHEHRLATYRLLVEAGPVGLPAGEIAERLNIVPSSLTFHVQALARADLITQRRASRNVIYAADFSAMNDLLSYLAKNCCGQDPVLHPALCNPCGAATQQSSERSDEQFT